ncbi:uncharacterized protein IWZ02DRAFT_298823 [Phyllosticta citriasiana]|uniref:uncharacterized protein n=1 Tax=Phyllosticta citriasiana TaxID=595635 RepID=UPI0030FD5F16
MSSSSPAPARGHARGPSTDERRRVVTRQSTKGPLDADFNPLSDGPAPAPSAAAARSPQPSLRANSPAASLSTPSANLEKDFSHLLHPGNFHPLPPQTIPQPFLSSGHQPHASTPLHDLLANGHYRLAASAAANALLKETLPSDHEKIFELLYVRLACLSLLNQHALAATEAKPLGDLSSAFYRHPLTGAHLVPWELRVLAVRLMGLGYGDWRRGVMGYYELAREARLEAIRAQNPEAKQMWKNRLLELGIRVANALIEMGECEGAARHLTTLGPAESSKTADEAEPTPRTPEKSRLKTMEALTWLRVGDVDAAKRSVAASSLPSPPTPSTADAAPPVDPLNALIAMAEGDYTSALTVWEALAAQNPTDHMIAQNRAVCLLYVGRITDARDALERVIDEAQDSCVAFHALTFNLSTIYELCTERARDRKFELVEKVAAMEPSAMGWERQAADFKL